MSQSKFAMFNLICFFIHQKKLKKGNKTLFFYNMSNQIRVYRINI